MHIRSVQIDSFRNLERQQIDLSEGTNLFVGDNGQGKTNLLEAIHVVSSLRSFRPARIKEMIHREKASAEVGAQTSAAGVPMSLRVVLEPTGRRLWIGHNQVASVAEYLGQLNAMAFTPDDLAMIKGGPSQRRRFLDRSAFLFHPSHLKAVRDFKTALAARNRLLQTGESAASDQLESFTRTAARFGSQVTKGRAELASRLGPTLVGILSELTGGSKDAALDFRPGWQVGTQPDEDGLFAQWMAQIERDRRRRSTGVGPQLDDFDVQLDGDSARRFASQGQQRTTAVGLLLAVVEEMKIDGAEPPVILLDDVSSELDGKHRSRLFERVLGLGLQVLVTTTDSRLVDSLDKANPRRFSVCEGRVAASGG